MPDYDRYLSCTLGALLMDQIITAAPDDIEKATHAINRAWVQMTGLESRDEITAQGTHTAQGTPRPPDSPAPVHISMGLSGIPRKPSKKPDTPHTPAHMDTDPHNAS